MIPVIRNMDLREINAVIEELYEKIRKLESKEPNALVRSAPRDPAVGQQWVDVQNSQVKVWDGQKWIVSAADTSGFNEFDDAGWNDLVVSPATMKIPASSAPTEEDWGGSGASAVKVLKFDNGGGEYSWYQMQLPHSYVRGTDLHPHIHFAPKTAIGAGQTVVWRVTYKLQNVNGVFGADQTVDMTFTDDGSGSAANSHLIAGGATVDGSDLDLSAVMYGRLERIPGTFTGDVYLVSADAHIQINRLGSEGQYTG